MYLKACLLYDQILVQMVCMYWVLCYNKCQSIYNKYFKCHYCRLNVIINKHSKLGGFLLLFGRFHGDMVSKSYVWISTIDNSLSILYLYSMPICTLLSQNKYQEEEQKH